MTNPKDMDNTILQQICAKCGSAWAASEVLPCPICKQTINTKTTEWEAELKRRIEHGSDENLESIVPFVHSLLHQSRTELMRNCGCDKCLALLYEANEGVSKKEL